MKNQLNGCAGNAGLKQKIRGELTKWEQASRVATGMLLAAIRPNSNLEKIKAAYLNNSAFFSIREEVAIELNRQARKRKSKCQSQREMEVLQELITYTEDPQMRRMCTTRIPA